MNNAEKRYMALMRRPAVRWPSGGVGRLLIRHQERLHSRPRIIEMFKLAATESRNTSELITDNLPFFAHGGAVVTG
jgi:hypothetical protein